MRFSSSWSLIVCEPPAQRQPWPSRSHWEDRHTGRQTEQTDRQTVRQAGRQIDKQRDRQANRQTDKHLDRRTDRQSHIWIGEQTDIARRSEQQASRRAGREIRVI